MADEGGQWRERCSHRVHRGARIRYGQRAERSRWSRAAPSSGSTSSVTPSMATTRTGCPAPTGVARFVRALQRASPTLTTPSGSTVSTTWPIGADHPLPPDRRRREAGPHHRRHPDDEREHDPADAGEQRDPRRPQRRTGQRLEQPEAADDREQHSHPGPQPGYSDLYVDGEGEHGGEDQADRPPPRRQRGQPGARQHDGDRPDDAGDPDAGGEELEHQQAQAGEQQQVGDGRDWPRCGTAGRPATAWRSARSSSSPGARCRRRAPPPRSSRSPGRPPRSRRARPPCS